jgi:hypothetical protein
VESWVGARSDGGYWEHGEMNSDEARELSAAFAKNWHDHKRGGPVRSIWHYPHLRTLGFSKSDIFAQFRENAESNSFLESATKRFQIFLDRYFSSLLVAEKESRLLSLSHIGND